LNIQSLDFNVAFVLREQASYLCHIISGMAMSVIDDIVSLRAWLREDRSRLQKLTGMRESDSHCTASHVAGLSFEDHSNWNNAPYRGDEWKDFRNWSNGG
jgi:hypothetical protein